MHMKNQNSYHPSLSYSKKTDFLKHFSSLICNTQYFKIYVLTIQVCR